MSITWPAFRAPPHLHARGRGRGRSAAGALSAVWVARAVPVRVVSAPSTPLTVRFACPVGARRVHEHRSAAEHMSATVLDLSCISNVASEGLRR